MILGDTREQKEVRTERPATEALSSQQHWATAVRSCWELWETVRNTPQSHPDGRTRTLGYLSTEPLSVIEGVWSPGLRTRQHFALPRPCLQCVWVVSRWGLLRVHARMETGGWEMEDWEGARSSAEGLVNGKGVAEDFKQPESSEMTPGEWVWEATRHAQKQMLRNARDSEEVCDSEFQSGFSHHTNSFTM